MSVHVSLQEKAEHNFCHIRLSQSFPFRWVWGNCVNMSQDKYMWHVFNHLMCFSIVFNYVFLTLDRGWGYRRILTISDFHTPHSKHGEQFCNFWTYGFAFGINLSSLEGRLSALSQPRQTPRQTSRGVEDWRMACYSVRCQKTNSCLRQGKCRPTVATRKRTTQDHQDKWKESKDIKWYKTYQDILPWSYMYVWICLDIQMYMSIYINMY